MMKRFLLHLSYFGTRYSGFQKQNIDGKLSYDDPHTVCGLLEIALKGCEALNHPTVFPSSRTDKGVHALSNAVHVDLTEGQKRITSEAITTQVNRFFMYNDHDIRVLKTQQVHSDFHSRFNAYQRHYMYRLAVPRPGVQYYQKFLTPCPVTEINRCLFLRDPEFDSDAVKAACHIFVGEKDFAALSTKTRPHSQQRSTIRVIDSLKLEPGYPLLPCPHLTNEFDFWNIECFGRSFVYHQMRRMVSSLIAYGTGKVTLADLQRLIDEPVESSWKPIGQIVPPDGLFLVNVMYHAEDLAFDEQLTSDELKLKALGDEHVQLVNTLKNYKGSVSEKIQLKDRLLKVKKGLCDGYKCYRG